MYIILFSATINGLVALYVFYINPKKITNKVFVVLVLFFSIFCISELITRTAGTKELALIGGRICYSVFILASCLGVHFSLVFPRRYPKEKNFILPSNYLLFTIYATCIIIVIIFNMLISIQDVQLTKWGYRVTLSSSTSFLIYWLLFCTIYASANLIHTYFKKFIAINEKKQIEFVTIGFLLVVIFSLGTNLIPPLFKIGVLPMASLSFALFSLIITFSMKKYQLMKLTTAETADIIIDTMADSLIVVDKNELIVNVNKSALNLTGYRRNELEGIPLKKIVRLPESKQKESEKIFESKIFNRSQTNDKVRDTEVDFIAKNRTYIPMNILASPIYDKRKNLKGVIIVARNLTETKKLIYDLEDAKLKLEEKVNERTKDLLKINKELQVEIKEREKAEVKIKASLEEKELLLKEIHHRVKNNLQIISSLLDIQAERLKGDKNVELFQESQSRIKSMSLIHEQLYKSHDLAKIDFDEYIRNLIAKVSRSYGANVDNISFKINIKDVFLNIDKAIPCGLIVNELISNSLKHGFLNAKKGEISIDFHLDKDNNYTFMVNDNGVGIPEDFNIQTTRSLGLRLVNMLTQQLKGFIEIDRDHGTTFKITFPGLKNKEGG